MKKIFSKTVLQHLRGASCCALLFAASEIAWAQSADVQRAIDAYNEGDYAAAMAVWEPLANQGNRDAQFAMGVLYYEGHGVNKNLDEALAWFRKAADSEHPTAMFNLGWPTGRDGLSQSFAQAVDWWEQAAESGDVASVQSDLPTILAKGRKKILIKPETGWRNRKVMPMPNACSVSSMKKLQRVRLRLHQHQAPQLLLQLTRQGLRKWSQ